MFCQGRHLFKLQQKQIFLGTFAIQTVNSVLVIRTHVLHSGNFPSRSQCYGKCERKTSESQIVCLNIVSILVLFAAVVMLLFFEYNCRRKCKFKDKNIFISATDCLNPHLWLSSEVSEVMIHFNLLYTQW